MDNKLSRIPVLKQTDPSLARASVSEGREAATIASQSANRSSPLLERIENGKELPVTIIEQAMLETLLPKRKDEETAGRGEFLWNRNVSNCFRLTGRFSPAVLEQTMSEIVRRHEVLRTTYTMSEGRPGRVIAKEQPFALRILDLRNLPAQRRRDEALELVSREHKRTFDLTEGPLWKFLLVQLDQNDYLVHLCLDHFICDDWSMDLLFRDIWVLYYAHMAGHPSPLEELSVQLSDLASWQRRHLHGERLKRLTAYWQRQLDGVGLRPAIHLVNENPVARLSGHSPYAKQALDLSSALRAALSKMSRREGVTLPMTLLTAFVSLFHRYTEEEDIGFILIQSNRHRPEFRQVVGWLADESALRTKVRGAETFSHVLRQVQLEMLEAYDHLDLPFAWFPGFANLSNQLLPPYVVINISTGMRYGSPGKLPDSRVPPQSPFRISKLAVSEAGISKTREPGMFILADLKTEALGVSVDYEVGRYKAAVIAELLVNYGNILKAIVIDPGTRLADLPISITR